MATRTHSSIAARILHALAFRHRSTQSAFPRIHYWPCPRILLADCASRLFPKFYGGLLTGSSAHSNSAFLHLFSSTFPLPHQHVSWQMLLLPPNMISLATSLLLGKWSLPQQWTWKPDFGTGAGGATTLSSSTNQILSCQPCLHPTASICYWYSLPKSVQVFWAEAARSRPPPSLRRSATSVRPSNWLATATLGWPKIPPPFTSP